MGTESRAPACTSGLNMTLTMAFGCTAEALAGLDFGIAQEDDSSKLLTAGEATFPQLARRIAAFGTEGPNLSKTSGCLAIQRASRRRACLKRPAAMRRCRLSFSRPGRAMRRLAPLPGQQVA